MAGLSGFGRECSAGLASACARAALPCPHEHFHAAVIRASTGSMSGGRGRLAASRGCDPSALVGRIAIAGSTPSSSMDTAMPSIGQPKSTIADPITAWRVNLYLPRSALAKRSASALCAGLECRRMSRARSCSASSRFSEISHPRPFFLTTGSRAPSPDRTLRVLRSLHAPSSEIAQQLLRLDRNFHRAAVHQVIGEA